MNQHDIINMVKNKGFKVTPQRRAIIEALLFLEKPPTAKEVLDIVRGKYPDISLDTVYRNLNLLAKIDCLIQINLINSETSRFEILKNHHHHLVCLGCGEAVCLDNCILDRHMGVLREKGYQITGHAFEIYGYCPDCVAQENNKLNDV